MQREGTNTKETHNTMNMNMNMKERMKSQFFSEEFALMELLEFERQRALMSEKSVLK